MSFDLSSIPTEADFLAANPTPAPPTPPDEETLNARRVERIQNRITRFFSQSSNGGRHEITIHIGGLSAEAKADLIAQVEAKGYACVEEGNRMTIGASA